MAKNIGEYGSGPSGEQAKKEPGVRILLRARLLIQPKPTNHVYETFCNTLLDRDLLRAFLDLLLLGQEEL